MVRTDLRRLAIVLALSALCATACKQEQAKVREPEPSGETTPTEPPDEPETSSPEAADSHPTTKPTDTDDPALPAGHPPTGAPANETFLRTDDLPELEVAVADPGAEAFRKLIAERLAEATGLYVDDWWGARLGGPDAEPAWIARLCVDGDEAWHHNWFVVLASTGTLHVVPFRAQSRAVCSGSAANQGLDKPLETRDETFLELFDSDLYGRFHKQHLGERDGRLVVLREARSSGAGPTGTEVHAQRLDWEHGWFEHRVRAVMAGDPTTPRTDDVRFTDVPDEDAPRVGALLTVERDADSTLPTWTHLTGELTGPDDASVQVVATAETAGGATVTAKPETSLALTLRLQDDHPTPDDRLHITWCTDATRCTTTGKRTLVIEPHTGDTPTVGWLESDKSLAPPPVTRTDDGRLTVKLPLVALASESPDDAPRTPGARSYPLTVRFTDHDPDEPQPATLSTAMLDSAPSRLVALPTLTRLPLAGRPLGPDDAIVTDETP